MQILAVSGNSRPPEYREPGFSLVLEEVYQVVVSCVQSGDDAIGSHAMSKSAHSTHRLTSRTCLLLLLVRGDELGSSTGRGV
jgi:hypothetical protein